MFRLSMILHLFVGSTIAGSAIVAALVAGMDGYRLISMIAVIGFLVSFPVSYVIAKKLYEA